MQGNAARAASTWPGERVAELTWFVEAGCHSFKEIGRLMGITKNAAIGKARRLSLDGPRMKGPRGPEPSTLASRLDALDVFPPAGRCVFPLGDMAQGGSFCGAPVETELAPYCAEHRARCWVKEHGPREHAAEPMFMARGRAR